MTFCSLDRFEKGAPRKGDFAGYHVHRGSSQSLVNN